MKRLLVVLALIGAACRGRDSCPDLPDPVDPPAERIDLPGSPFAGGLSIDGFGVALRTEQGEVSFTADPPVSSGSTTTIAATAPGVARTTTLVLDTKSGGVVVRHRYEFSAPMTVVESMAFHARLEEVGNARLFYGPASGTAYMEDYFAVPVVGGYAKPGRMIDGGTPLQYVWRKEGGVAIAVLAAQPGTYEMPVVASESGVTLAVRHRPDESLGEKRSFAAGEGLDTEAVLVLHHRGDFHGPLVRYAELLEPLLGRPLRDRAVPSWMRLPYWKTWGFSTSSGEFTKDQVRSVLPDLQYLGIPWVVLDYGWFVTEGNWSPNAGTFPGGESDLEAFLAELKAEGFRVGLWYQPLQLDHASDEIDPGLPAYAIRTEGGEVFLDDDDLALLNASLPAVQDYVLAELDRFAAMGVDEVYLDSQMAQLANPPDFSRADPLASHRALPSLYSAIRDRAAATVTSAGGMAIEICPDGRSQTVLNMPQDVTNAGDPKDDRALRAETKELKALQGARAVVGAYVDHFAEDNPLSGSFLNVVGSGAKIETFFTTLDAGRREEFKAWMDFWYSEGLGLAATLDLYDVGFDHPEGHVLEVGSKRYYSFFTWTEGVDARVGCKERRLEEPRERDFSGNLVLRGLTPGASYQVVRLTRPPGDAPFTVIAGPDGDATIEASFSKEVMLVVSPL